MTSREYIERKAAVMSRALEALTPTYDCQDGRNPIGACSELPSEQEVLRVLAFLDDVFYPGYRSDCTRGEPVQTLVIERLDEVYDTLYRQVKRALPLRTQNKYSPLVEGELEKPDEAALSVESERVVGLFME